MVLPAADAAFKLARFVDDKAYSLEFLDTIGQ